MTTTGRGSDAMTMDRSNNTCVPSPYYTCITDGFRCGSDESGWKMRVEMEADETWRTSLRCVVTAVAIAAAAAAAASLGWYMYLGTCIFLSPPVTATAVVKVKGGGAKGLSPLTPVFSPPHLTV